jgi:hypothetical protein
MFSPELSVYIFSMTVLSISLDSVRINRINMPDMQNVIKIFCLCIYDVNVIQAKIF